MKSDGVSQGLHAMSKTHDAMVPIWIDTRGPPDHVFRVDEIVVAACCRDAHAALVAWETVTMNDVVHDISRFLWWWKEQKETQPNIPKNIRDVKSNC